EGRVWAGAGQTTIGALLSGKRERYGCRDPRRRAAVHASGACTERFHRAGVGQGGKRPCRYRRLSAHRELSPSLRRSRKKLCTRCMHRAASTPELTSTWWFSLG